MLHRKKRLRHDADRKGMATIEFALILPLFILLLLGTIEFGTALNASQKMINAAKSGARFAAMDWTDKLAAGESPNDKVEKDVRNFLTASGLPGDKAVVEISHADGTGQGNSFDLSDEDNDLDLFMIEVQLKYSDVAVFPNHFFGDRWLREIVVHRAGRATLNN